MVTKEKNQKKKIKRATLNYDDGAKVCHNQPNVITTLL